MDGRIPFHFFIESRKFIGILEAAASLTPSGTDEENGKSGENAEGKGVEKKKSEKKGSDSVFDAVCTSLLQNVDASYTIPCDAAAKRNGDSLLHIAVTEGNLSLLRFSLFRFGLSFLSCSHWSASILFIL